MHADTVFIAFGSNMGNRRDFCDRAVTLMGLLPHSTLTGVSSYYETEPVNMEHSGEAMWFYNGVVRLNTQLPPERLLALCRETERSLGRDAGPRNGPRTMDLDVLFYGQRVVASPPLTLPHPRLHRRRFVLAPMAELAPDWVHPQHARTMQQLLDTLADTHRVHKLGRPPGAAGRAAGAAQPGR